MNLNTDKLIKEYIEQTGSRAKENANQWRSYAGLKGYITGYPMADYALRNIYSKELADAHEKGFVHINDLNGLCAYSYHGSGNLNLKYNGEEKCLNFAELYQLMEDNEETFAILNKEDKAYAYYPDSLYILDLVNGKNVYTRVTRVIMKSKNTAMYSISTRNGFSQIVTSNHPVITKRGDIEAKDVKVGDILTVAVLADYDEDLLLNTSIFEDEVYNVTEVYCDNEYVYDITTDTRHFFCNGILSHNCYGLDFQELLHQGLKGDDGSTPPEYFDTALGITETFIMKLSSQIAGAVAVNSPDILLAPYIKKNKLTYKEVRHVLKQFIYRINTRVRGSYEAPFTNFQLDITVPNRLKKVRPVIQGIKQDFTYQDCQKEVDMFNMALLDILDETNKPFPVVNMGIAKDFDWDSPIAEKIFKSIGTFGQPVISNYVNSDYDPDTTRSMCCSLRLDMSKIMKGSSSFGSNNGSGSVGVVTINLALLGCVAKDEAELLMLIGKYMDLAKDGLNSKRAFVEDWHERDMYPTLKQFSKDLRSLFSTIGVVGMNEMCLGLIGKGIDSEDGLSLSERVADYMNNKLSQYQVESENWYNGHGVFWNLEVVPAEGATRRLAQAMKKHFPDLAITSNGTQKDYITRGCWLPADKQYTLAYACEHQDRIQKKFSGGCNFNWYLESPIKDGKAVKSILHKIINNTSLPFISISPPVNVCPVCGKRVDDYCEHDISDEEIKERGLKTYEEN